MRFWISLLAVLFFCEVNCFYKIYINHYTAPGNLLDAKTKEVIEKAVAIFNREAAEYNIQGRLLEVPVIEPIINSTLIETYPLEISFDDNGIVAFAPSTMSFRKYLSIFEYIKFPIFIPNMGHSSLYVNPLGNSITNNAALLFADIANVFQWRRVCWIIDPNEIDTLTVEYVLNKLESGESSRGISSTVIHDNPNDQAFRSALTLVKQSGYNIFLLSLKPEALQRFFNNAGEVQMLNPSFSYIIVDLINNYKLPPLLHGVLKLHPEWSDKYTSFFPPKDVEAFLSNMEHKNIILFRVFTVTLYTLRRSLATLLKDASPLAPYVERLRQFNVENEETFSSFSPDELEKALKQTKGFTEDMLQFISDVGKDSTNVTLSQKEELRIMQLIRIPLYNDPFYQCIAGNSIAGMKTSFNCAADLAYDDAPVAMSIYSSDVQSNGTSAVWKRLFFYKDNLLTTNKMKAWPLFDQIDPDVRVIARSPLKFYEPASFRLPRIPDVSWLTGWYTPPTSCATCLMPCLVCEADREVLLAIARQLWLNNSDNLPSFGGLEYIREFSIAKSNFGESDIVESYQANSQAFTTSRMFSEKNKGDRTSIFTRISANGRTYEKVRLHDNDNTLTPYLIAPDFCSIWPGVVKCDNENTYSITLHNMIGPFPKGWESLKKVSALYLSNNQWSNMTLPKSLPCASLKHIDFSHSQITGSLPLSWGICKSLESINVENNLLSGPLPASYCNLRHLQYVNFSANQFSGEMPDCRFMRPYYPVMLADLSAELAYATDIVANKTLGWKRLSRRLYIYFLRKFLLKVASEEWPKYDKYCRKDAESGRNVEEFLKGVESYATKVKIRIIFQKCRQLYSTWASTYEDWIATILNFIESLRYISDENELSSLFRCNTLTLSVNNEYKASMEDPNAKVQNKYEENEMYPMRIAPYRFIHEFVVPMAEKNSGRLVEFYSPFSASLDNMDSRARPFDRFRLEGDRNQDFSNALVDSKAFPKPWSKAVFDVKGRNNDYQEEVEYTGKEEVFSFQELSRHFSNFLLSDAGQKNKKQFFEYVRVLSVNRLNCERDDSWLYRLKDIRIQSNNLSGPIPNFFSHLLYLGTIFLDNNKQLTGQIPCLTPPINSNKFTLELSNTNVKGPLCDKLKALLHNESVIVNDSQSEITFISSSRLASLSRAVTQTQISSAPAYAGTPFRINLPPSALACQPGYARVRYGECFPCQKGTYSDKGEMCVPCWEGTIQRNTGETTCAVCPQGTVPSEDKTICDLCPLGTSSDQAGQAKCRPCKIGRTSIKHGATECVYCRFPFLCNNAEQQLFPVAAPGFWIISSKRDKTVVPQPIESDSRRRLSPVETELRYRPEMQGVPIWPLPNRERNTEAKLEEEKRKTAMELGEHKKKLLTYENAQINDNPVIVKRSEGMTGVREDSTDPSEEDRIYDKLLDISRSNARKYMRAAPEGGHLYDIEEVPLGVAIFPRKLDTLLSIPCEDCIGNNECSRLSFGEFCSECSNGYYKRDGEGNGRCVECASKARIIFEICFYHVLFFSILSVICYLSLRDSVANRSIQAIILKIVLSWIELVSFASFLLTSAVKSASHSRVDNNVLIRFIANDSNSGVISLLEFFSTTIRSPLLVKNLGCLFDTKEELYLSSIILLAFSPLYVYLVLFFLSFVSVRYQSYARARRIANKWSHTPQNSVKSIASDGLRSVKSFFYTIGHHAGLLTGKSLTRKKKELTEVRSDITDENLDEHVTKDNTNGSSGKELARYIHKKNGHHYSFKRSKKDERTEMKSRLRMFINKHRPGANHHDADAGDDDVYWVPSPVHYWDKNNRTRFSLGDVNSITSETPTKLENETADQEMTQKRANSFRQDVFHQQMRPGAESSESEIESNKVKDEPFLRKNCKKADEYFEALPSGREEAIASASGRLENCKVPESPFIILGNEGSEHLRLMREREHLHTPSFGERRSLSVNTKRQYLRGEGNNLASEESYNPVPTPPFVPSAEGKSIGDSFIKELPTPSINSKMKEESVDRARQNSPVKTNLCLSSAMRNRVNKMEGKVRRLQSLKRPSIFSRGLKKECIRKNVAQLYSQLDECAQRGDTVQSPSVVPFPVLAEPVGKCKRQSIVRDKSVYPSVETLKIRKRKKEKRRELRKREEGENKQATAEVEKLEYILANHAEEQNERSLIVKRALSMFIVAVYFIQPRISNFLVKAVSCSRLDVNRLSANLSILCDGEYRHTIYLGYACLFAIVFFPLTIFYYHLRKHRFYLYNKNVKQIWGFLYNGYAPKYYFWELYLMARKLIVLLPFVIQGLSFSERLLFLSVCSVIFLGLQLRIQPWDKRCFGICNFLESLSLMSVFITNLAAVAMYIVRLESPLARGESNALLHITDHSTVITIGLVAFLVSNALFLFYSIIWFIRPSLVNSSIKNILPKYLKSLLLLEQGYTQLKVLNICSHKASTANNDTHSCSQHESLKRVMSASIPTPLCNVMRTDSKKEECHYLPMVLDITNLSTKEREWIQSLLKELLWPQMTYDKANKRIRSSLSKTNTREVSRKKSFVFFLMFLLYCLGEIMWYIVKIIMLPFYLLFSICHYAWRSFCAPDTGRITYSTSSPAPKAKSLFPSVSISNSPTKEATLRVKESDTPTDANWDPLLDEKDPLPPIPVWDTTNAEKLQEKSCWDGVTRFWSEFKLYYRLGVREKTVEINPKEKSATFLDPTISMEIILDAFKKAALAEEFSRTVAELQRINPKQIHNAFKVASYWRSAFLKLSSKKKERDVSSSPTRLKSHISSHTAISGALSFHPNKSFIPPHASSPADTQRSGKGLTLKQPPDTFAKKKHLPQVSIISTESPHASHSPFVPYNSPSTSLFPSISLKPGLEHNNNSSSPHHAQNNKSSAGASMEPYPDFTHSTTYSSNPALDKATLIGKSTTVENGAPFSRKGSLDVTSIVGSKENDQRHLRVHSLQSSDKNPFLSLGDIPPNIKTGRSYLDESPDTLYKSSSFGIDTNRASSPSATKDDTRSRESLGLSFGKPDTADYDSFLADLENKEKRNNFEFMSGWERKKKRNQTAAVPSWNTRELESVRENETHSPSRTKGIIRSKSEQGNWVIDINGETVREREEKNVEIVKPGELRVSVSNGGELESARQESEKLSGRPKYLVSMNKAQVRLVIAIRYVVWSLRFVKAIALMRKDVMFRTLSIKLSVEDLYTLILNYLYKDGVSKVHDLQKKISQIHLCMHCGRLLRDPLEQDTSKKELPDYPK